MMFRGAETIGQTQPQREQVHVVGVCPQDASGRAGCRGEHYDQLADKLAKSCLDVGIVSSTWGAVEQVFFELQSVEE
eukprot:6118047-Lingulodinium_polyedra.AAC.1